MSDDHSSTMITHIAQSLSRSHENLKSLSSSLFAKSELSYHYSLDDLYLSRSDFLTTVKLPALSITKRRRTATKTTSILDEEDHSVQATLGNASANTFYDSPSSESSSASSSDDEEESEEEIDASSEDFDDRDAERISASNAPGTSAFQRKPRDSSVGSFFIGHNEEDDDEATEEDEYDDDEEDDEDEDDWEPSRIMYTGGSALTPCMSRASMDRDDVRAKPPQRVCSFDWDSNVQRSADSDWDSTCGDDLPDEMDSEDFPTLHTWPHSWIWNPQQTELPSIHFHFEESNPPDQFSWTPLQDSKFGNALTVPGYYAYNVRHPPMMLDPTEEEEEELCFSIEEAAIVASSSELEDSATLALPSVSALTLMAPPMYTCSWDAPYQYDPKTGHSSTKVFSLAEQATEAIYSAPASSGSGGSCRWNKIRNARRSLSTSRSPSPQRALKEVPKRTAPEEPIKSSIQVSPPLIDDENGQSSLATNMSLPPMPVIRPPPPPPTRTMSEPSCEPIERGRSITRRMSAPVVTRNGKF